jgi:hypothetical protein
MGLIGLMGCFEDEHEHGLGPMRLAAGGRGISEKKTAN